MLLKKYICFSYWVCHLLICLYLSVRTSDAGSLYAILLSCSLFVLIHIWTAFNIVWYSPCCISPFEWIQKDKCIFNCLCTSAAKSLNVGPIKPHYSSQPILLMHTWSSLSECFVWEAGSGYQCLSNNYVRLTLWCQNVSYWLNICKILNETWWKKKNTQKRQTSNTVPYLCLKPRHPLIVFAFELFGRKSDWKVCCQMA